MNPTPEERKAAVAQATERYWEARPFVDDMLASFNLQPQPPWREPRCAQPVVSRVALGAVAVLVVAVVAWWWA